MTVLTIAAAAAAALMAGLLVAALVMINGLGAKIDELAGRLKAASARPAATPMPPQLDERLHAVEASLKSLASASGRLERSVLADRRNAPPAMPAAPPPDVPPRRDVLLGAEAAQGPSPVPGRDGLGTAGSPSGDGRTGAEGRGEEDERSVTPDDLIEAFRELIARPRKNEITRWFDDLDGLSCEATDEDVFQIVGRGEGARLMLVPLTERFGIVLPSALMVVDFATSFSDVLSARSATRRTFAFDADGSGTLRLVQPATAVMIDGVWKLKAPGRLAGLANG